MLPATDEGIEVVRACAAERIGTGVGAWRPEQALVAARAGAGLCLPAVGQTGGVDGNDMIRKLVALFRTARSDEVIADRDPLPTNIIDAAPVARRRGGSARGLRELRRREHAPG